MEIIIGISSILVAIIIALIPYVRSKYFLKPELTIEVKPKPGLSNPKGLSNKNDFSRGYVEAETALRIFKLTWRFEIIITNNSGQIAFYSEFEFNPNGPRFTKIDTINNLKPIKPAESITLKAEYSKFEEKTGKGRTQIVQDPPEELKDLEILLSYQNLKKRKFYTLFEYNAQGNMNKFLRNKPKEYKNN